MTTKVWEETIKHRPPARKERVGGHPWTVELHGRLLKVRTKTIGSVKAFITIYIDQTNPDTDGDLDNYAKIILDELESGILRDDRDVDELNIRRIQWNRKDKMTMRLEWSTN